LKYTITYICQILNNNSMVPPQNYVISLNLDLILIREMQMKRCGPLPTNL